MAIARKLKKLLEKHFPAPDKIVLRDEDRIIGIVTSARFRRMDTLARQDLIHEILAANLSDAERRQVLMIVALTPEEELANVADE